MFLPGEAGGEPLQHLSVSEAPGQELVRGSEKERETQTGSEDSHWTEGHLLSAPTAARVRPVRTSCLDTHTVIPQPEPV